MKENNNIHTNDKLICTQGNAYYSEGEVYTVGRIVNDKYFQLLTSGNDDHWYATLDDQAFTSALILQLLPITKLFFDKIA